VFRNVLVAMDGSASGRQALVHAIEMARASGGRLGLLWAVPRPSVGIWRMKALPMVDPGPGELEREAQRLLDEAERTVPADVPVTKLLTHARPADALLEEAAGGRWDLIVATRPLRASPVPVLVIPSAPPR